jgi:transposase
MLCQQGWIEHKIHATADALGNPIGFHLTAGQACDLDGVPQLKADTVLADKGYDADQRGLLPLEQAGKTTVIPPEANRKQKMNFISG